MWQVYLEMKEYATALAYCRTPMQRDQVYLAQVILVFMGFNTYGVLYNGDISLGH